MTRALVPVDQLHVVTVAATERAVIVKDGRPLRILCEGEHIVWRVETVVVETVDVSGVVCPPLRDARRELLVGNEYVETVVPEGAVSDR